MNKSVRVELRLSSFGKLLKINFTILVTIEDGIGESAAEIENAATLLKNAAASQAKYRRKVLILLAIAVIIGLIVTGIIVSQLKS